MLTNLIVLLASAALSMFLPFSVVANELPAGTTLEVRLSVATGSRISHAGDRVEGTVIAPVLFHEWVLIPQGTTVSGVVATVERLGLGLKHRTAGIGYRFQTLRLPDGETIPIETRLIEVEMAKEGVNTDGSIRGIHPTASLSSFISLYVLPFLYATPTVAGPALAIKILIARSPDPEIYFPPGTEVFLQLTAPAEIHLPNNSALVVAPLSSNTIADARQLLGSFSQPRATEGSGRPSDRVNLLFLGSQEQIDRAFHAAGWSGAQRRSAMSIYRLYHSLVARIGYSMAPMQKLMLNGKPSDAAYEKSLDTFSKRHHLRLWRQQSDFWLSTATEDVGYRFRGTRLTHATDPWIDNERTKVVNDLNFTGCLDAATLLERDPLQNDSWSSGFVVTDGNVAVVRLNDCRSPRMMPAATANFGPAGHSRIVRGLLGLRNDIARSNPIFLGYNTVRLARAKKRAQTNTNRPLFRSSDQQLDLLQPTQAKWVRGSVLYEPDPGRPPAAAYGDSTYQSPVLHLANYYGNLIVTDRNGDGIPNLLTGGGYPSGNGGGAFQPQVSIAFCPMLAADLTSGGQIDLAGSPELGVGVMLNVSRSAAFTLASSASFQVGPVAPESLVSAFGSGLSSSTATAPFGTAPLQLAGATVTVKDAIGVSRTAPLLFVSPGQIIFEVPAGTSLGPATVTITNAASASQTTVSSPVGTLP